MIIERDEKGRIKAKPKFDFVTNGRKAQRKSWEAKHKRRWEKMKVPPLPFRYDDET